VFLLVLLSAAGFLAGANLNSMLFPALDEESIDAERELLEEPYPISELEEKVPLPPEEWVASFPMAAATPANLGSACSIPFLGFSPAFTPTGGGRFSQSHSTELFWFQSIPKEPMPGLKISGAAAPTSYVKSCCHLRDRSSGTSFLLLPQENKNDSGRFLLLLEAWSRFLNQQQQHGREPWSSPNPASRGGASIDESVGSDQREPASVPRHESHPWLR